MITVEQVGRFYYFNIYGITYFRLTASYGLIYIGRRNKELIFINADQDEVSYGEMSLFQRALDCKPIQKVE